MPLVIIDGGEYDEKNIKLTGMPLSFFENILKKQGITKHKKVLVLTLDGTGKIYLQEYGKKRVIFNVELPEGVAW